MEMENTYIVVGGFLTEVRVLQPFLPGPNTGVKGNRYRRLPLVIHTKGMYVGSSGHTHTGGVYATGGVYYTRGVFGNRIFGWLIHTLCIAEHRGCVWVIQRVGIACRIFGFLAEGRAD